VARLFPQEDVYGSLLWLCQKHKAQAVVVVSAVGQLKEVELGFFKQKGDYSPTVLAGFWELLFLSGFAHQQDGQYEFHLHGVFSDANKQTQGGHLLGAKVSVTLEIALLKTSLVFQRKTEEETGLRGMFLEN
jgi:predicted DNA-binding protein with PD1-like motif